MGRQWLILGFTVGKMLVTIGLVTHILSCIWFGVGQYATGAAWHGLGVVAGC